MEKVSAQDEGSARQNAVNYEAIFRSDSCEVNEFKLTISLTPPFLVWRPKIFPNVDLAAAMPELNLVREQMHQIDSWTVFGVNGLAGERAANFR